MTEYSVQTHNIFDFLNQTEEKPKSTRKPTNAQKTGEGSKGGKQQAGNQRGAKPTPVTSSKQAASSPSQKARGNQPKADTPNAAASIARHKTRGGEKQWDQPSDVTAADKAPRGRQFDRHSGTGRPPNENRRKGHGKGNWGTPGSELQDLVDEDLAKADVDAKEAKKKKKKGKRDAQEEGQDEAKEPEIPEEDLMTFDEWQKLKAEKAPKVSLPKKREAGEGVQVDPKWSAAVPLEPKKGQEEASPQANKKAGGKAGKADKGKPQDAGDLTNFFNFEAGRRGGRGGRGGRGSRGGKGGRPRGGGRQDQGDQVPKKFTAREAPHFNPNDEASFPALT